jgi:anti-sigma B factor antagonist
MHAPANSEPTGRLPDDEVRVWVRGEIDLCTAPDLRASIDAALGTRDVRAVVIDLADCTFMDSSGLNVLVAAADAARQRRQAVRITGAHGVVQRVIELTGLDTVLPLGPEYVPPA